MRRFMTSTATVTLVPAFVFGIDYCHSLLFGSTHDDVPFSRDSEICSSSNVLQCKIM